MKHFVLIISLANAIIFCASQSHARLALSHATVVSANELGSWPVKYRVDYLKLLAKFGAKIESKEPGKLYVNKTALNLDFVTRLFLEEACAIETVSAGSDCMNALNFLTVENNKGHLTCTGGYGDVSCDKPIDGSGVGILCASELLPADTTICVRRRQGASNTCLAEMQKNDWALLKTKAQELSNEKNTNAKDEKAELDSYLKQVDNFCDSKTSESKGTFYQFEKKQDCQNLQKGAQAIAAQLLEEKKHGEELTKAKLEASKVCEFVDTKNNQTYVLLKDGDNSYKGGSINGQNQFVQDGYKFVAKQGNIFAFDYQGTDDSRKGGQSQISYDEATKKCTEKVIPPATLDDKQKQCANDGNVVCVARVQPKLNICEGEGIDVATPNTDKKSDKIPKLIGDIYTDKDGAKFNIFDKKMGGLFGKKANGNLGVAQSENPLSLFPKNKSGYLEKQTLSNSDSDPDLSSLTGTDDATVNMKNQLAQLKASCQSPARLKKVISQSFNDWFASSKDNGEMWVCAKTNKRGDKIESLEGAPRNYVILYKDDAKKIQFLETGFTNVDHNPANIDVFGPGSKNPFVHLDAANTNGKVDDRLMVYQGKQLACAKNKQVAAPPPEKPFNLVKKLTDTKYIVCESKDNTPKSYVPSDEEIDVLNKDFLVYKGGNNRAKLGPASIETLTKTRGTEKCILPELMGSNATYEKFDVHGNPAEVPQIKSTEGGAPGKQ